MIIALGTTSSQKKDFLEEILRELKIEATIAPVDVLSNVSEQPITEIETKTGSINRAKAALKMSPQANIGIGIEVGYELNTHGDFEIFCFATIVDNQNQQISSRSSKMLLPLFHQKILKENKPLGEYVRQFLADNPDPKSQKIGLIIRDRKPFIQESIKAGLLRYFK